MKKKLEISLEKAKELYKEGGAIKELLLETFTEKELSGKKEFSDLDLSGGHSALEHVSLSEHAKGVGSFPKKEMAVAALAMSQLAWWMRHPEYNGSDQSDWCDWRNGNVTKHIIYYDSDSVLGSFAHTTKEFLTFKTHEIRDRFLEDHLELIEQAKPLL